MLDINTQNNNIIRSHFGSQMTKRFAAIINSAEKFEKKTLFTLQRKIFAVLYLMQNNVLAENMEVFARTETIYNAGQFLCP